MFKIILFLSLTFLFACKKEYQPSILEEKISACIDEYANCNDYVTLNSEKKSLFSKILYAKWQNREMRYESADSIYNSISLKQLENSQSTSTLIDYVISHSINNRRLRKPNIEEIDYALALKNIAQDQYVELLIEKSAALRDLLETTYAEACIKLALQQKIKNHNTKCKLRLTSSVFYARESNFEESEKHHNEAVKICINKDLPICKYVFAIAKQMQFDDNLDLIKDNINSNPNKSYYSPWIDKYTNLTLGLISPDLDTAIHYIRKNIKQNNENNCLEDLSDLRHLIEIYLKKNKHELAQKLIIQYFNCCNIHSIQPDYRIYQSAYKYYLNQHSIHQGINYLDSAILSNYKEIETSKQQLSKSDNLHFSDLRLENLIDLIDILRLEEKLLQNSEYRKILDNRLSEYKNYTLNLTTDTYNAFNNKGYSGLKQYLKLSSEIDSLMILESSVESRKETIKKIYSSEKKLFNLTQSLLKNSSKIHNDPSKSSITKIRKNNNSLPDHVIEIIRGHSNYYVLDSYSYSLKIKSINGNILDDEIERIITLVKQKGNLDSIRVASQKIKNLLNINLSRKETLIIPEGKLSEFPFELLTEEPPKVIFYSSLHNNSFNTEYISPQKIALFSYTDKSTLDTGSKLDFSELPHSLLEVTSISKQYDKIHIYKGKEMTTSKISENFSNEILHISTHSFSNPENILGNYLIVRNEKGMSEKMYGYQIKNSICTADLVILSSCNSGTGTYKPGAGTFSLSRDFLAAGAKTVIKSLWNVNEASTAELMISFHTYFQNHSASAALTLAKRDMASSDKYAHPYYWAGFVLEGNPNIYLDKE